MKSSTWNSTFVGKQIPFQININTNIAPLHYKNKIIDVFHELVNMNVNMRKGT
jgi:hypothetical protein